MLGLFPSKHTGIHQNFRQLGKSFSRKNELVLCTPLNPNGFGSILLFFPIASLYFLLFEARQWIWITIWFLVSISGIIGLEVFDYNGVFMRVSRDLQVSMQSYIQEKEAAIVRLKRRRFPRCREGDDTVDLVRKKEYSIVLMDLQMPEMDGYEATNRILGLHPKIPTIVLSADTTNIDREKLESKGFRELPQKPLFS
ncbi:MAG: response regulator [Leptospira sp.]|nr:response regulator [Leptospira sp.]